MIPAQHLQEVDGKVSELMETTLDGSPTEFKQLIEDYIELNLIRYCLEVLILSSLFFVV